MAAEDLKHLFPTKEEGSKDATLEISHDLSFNVDERTPKSTIKVAPEPMEFSNLPEDELLRKGLDHSTELLLEIIDKIENLDSKIDSGEYKKMAIHRGKVLDHRISKVLQTLIKSNPQNKADILTIKKYLTDFIKAIS